MDRLVNQKNQPDNNAIVRLGILFWMKFDVKGLASQLRFAYLPGGANSDSLRFNPDKRRTISIALHVLNSTFVRLGGNPKTLRLCILLGKGNRDLRVPFPPKELDRVLTLKDPDWRAVQKINRVTDLARNLSGLWGLGAASSASGGSSSVAVILKAAASILKVLLAMLDKAKADDPNDPVPEEYLPEETEE